MKKIINSILREIYKLLQPEIVKIKTEIINYFESILCTLFGILFSVLISATYLTVFPETHNMGCALGFYVIFPFVIIGVMYITFLSKYKKK